MKYILIHTKNDFPLPETIEDEAELYARIHTLLKDSDEIKIQIL